MNQSLLKLFDFIIAMETNSSILTYQGRVRFALAKAKLLKFLEHLNANVAYFVITLQCIEGN